MRPATNAATTSSATAAQTTGDASTIASTANAMTTAAGGTVQTPSSSSSPSTRPPVIVSPTTKAPIPTPTTSTTDAGVGEAGGGVSGAVIGGVIAGVIVVLIVVVVLLLYCRRRSSNESASLLAMRQLDNGYKGKDTSIILSNFSTTEKAEDNVYTAMYNFSADNADELNLAEDDVVSVLERNDSGWWKGRLRKSGATGWFPAEYVKEAPKPPVSSTAVTIVATPKSAATLTLAEQVMDGLGLGVLLAW